MYVSIIIKGGIAQGRSATIAVGKDRGGSYTGKSVGSPWDDIAGLERICSSIRCI